MRHPWLSEGHTFAVLIVTAVVAVLGLADAGIAPAQTPARHVAVFPKQPAKGYATECKIVRVIDGDTVVVEVKQSFHVRLLQCWAPESRTTNKAEKAKGLAAKEHLQTLVEQEDQGVLFIPLSGDLTEAITLGRVLGYVWQKGSDKSLSQIQVDGGFATTQKIK